VTICLIGIIESLLGYCSNTNAPVIFIGSNNGGITGPMIICFISVLMCFVIANVFSKAINIKKDNDLTV
jgi:hypothetical protein